MQLKDIPIAIIKENLSNETWELAKHYMKQAKTHVWKTILLVNLEV